MGKSFGKVLCIGVGIGVGVGVGVAICAYTSGLAVPYIAEGLVALGTCAEAAPLVYKVGCMTVGGITGGYSGHKVHEWATTSQRTNLNINEPNIQPEPQVGFDRINEGLLENPVEPPPVSFDSNFSLNSDVNRHSFFSEERIKDRIRRKCANETKVEDIYEKVIDRFRCLFCEKYSFKNASVVPCSVEHVIHSSCLKKWTDQGADSYRCPRSHNESIEISKIKRVDTRFMLRKFINKFVREM